MQQLNTVSGSHRWHPRTRVSWVPRTSAAIAAFSVVLALWAVPQAFATWGDRAAVSAGEIRTGFVSSAIALDAATPVFESDLNLGNIGSMLPGETQFRTVWVKNSGNVPFDVSLATGEGTSPEVTISAGAGKCEGGAAQMTRLSPEFHRALQQLAPGESDAKAQMCIAISLGEVVGTLTDAPFSVLIRTEVSPR